MGRIVPRGKNPSGGEHIEIEYAPPFAGIDSSAPAPYIRPNALVEGINAFVSNDSLIPMKMQNWDVNISWTNFPALVSGNCTHLVGFFDINDVLFAITSNDDGDGNPAQVQVWYWPGALTVNPISLGILTISPYGFIDSAVCFKVINNIAYFSAPNCAQVFQINFQDPTAVTFTLLTDYVGGSFMGELNGRLLLLNTTQYDGTSLNFFPYQVAWSAAAGAYSQFNPLVGGLVTGAGFNNLPDVEDIILGFFSTGPTGYVIRSQGITEMSPLNSGIQPFDFNHLWASQKGIGTLFPATVTQYGSLGAFISDTDFYTVGYDGINTITNKANSYLYAALNRFLSTSSIYQLYNTPVQAALSPLVVNNDTGLCYLFTIFTPSEVSTVVDSYIYLFSTKEWYHLQENVALDIGSSLLSVTSGKQLYEDSTSRAVPILILQQNVGGLYQKPTFRVFSNYRVTQGGIIYDGAAFNAAFTFPPEEAAFGRDVTVDGVAALVNGVEGDTLQVQINSFADATYPTVNMNTITLQQTGWQLVKTYPDAATSQKPYTAVFPQLIVTHTSGSAFAIAKISVFGTVNPNQRPV